MCIFSIFSYVVALSNRYYHFDVPITTNNWIHSVLNLIGPNEGPGISIYQDGEHKGNDITSPSLSYNQGDGKIVIGRFYTGPDNPYYASVEVDQMLFFNEPLTEAEILMLSQETN